MPFFEGTFFGWKINFWVYFVACNKFLGQFLAWNKFLGQFLALNKFWVRLSWNTKLYANITHLVQYESGTLVQVRM